MKARSDFERRGKSDQLAFISGECEESRLVLRGSAVRGGASVEGFRLGEEKAAINSYCSDYYRAALIDKQNADRFSSERSVAAASACV